MCNLFTNITKRSSKAETRVPEPINDILQRARTYWRSTGRYEMAHWRASDKFSRRHNWLGGISVVLAAAVATSAYASMAESLETNMRIVTGILAVANAVAAALLTFLAYGDRAKQHLKAGGRFARIRRSIDMYLLEFTGPETPGRSNAFASLKVISEELSSAVEESPSLSSVEYATGQIDFDGRYPINQAVGV